MSDAPSATETNATPRGIDSDKVSAWMAQNIPRVRLPLRFELIAGGRSNLTFCVTDAAGSRYVLRRPPTGHLLPTAHDMAREHRIISALGPAGIPVPPALGLCEDLSVTGAPFYVMGFVDGVIARNDTEAERLLDEASRHRGGLALIDTLAAIHGVDVDQVGLGDLARREGYIERQLRRWHANYLAANASRGGSPLETLEEVHQRLTRSVPAQESATVVHGDYRLDNCVLAPDGSAVLAVLDWELCTLGDPLADLGQLLAYWPEPGERSALGHSATTLAGFPRRNDLVTRYGALTGRDLSHLEFYVAFAFWKLACILEGVYARYVGGAMGDDGFDFSSYPESIAWLASQSLEASSHLAG